LSECIAFLGVGNMGGRMVRRLLSAGYAVTVFDPNQVAANAARDAGAQVADSPASAATGADVVLCSLPSPQSVIDATIGENGVVHSLQPGATVVDMSTTDPATAQRVAGTLASAGINFLDAPVSRGVAAAANGTLAIMVGGDPEIVDSCRGLLAQLGTDIVHVGPVGCGEMTKLCNNMMAAITMQGLAEVLVTGVKAGLDLKVLADVMSMSSGGSWILANYLPMTIFAGDNSAKFSLDLMHKDIGLYSEAAETLGLATPLSAICVQTNRMARSRGYGSLDYSAMISFFEELSGVRLVPPADVATPKEA
jgi:3-hydroxyisobutyrate dehydrogenase